VASRVPRGKIESIVGCDAQKLNAQGQTIDNRTTDKSKLKQIEGNKIKSRKRRQAGKKKVQCTLLLLASSSWWSSNAANGAYTQSRALSLFCSAIFFFFFLFFYLSFCISSFYILCFFFVVDILVSLLSGNSAAFELLSLLLALSFYRQNLWWLFNMQMHNSAQVTAQANSTPTRKGLLVHFLTLFSFIYRQWTRRLSGTGAEGRGGGARV